MSRQANAIETDREINVAIPPGDHRQMKAMAVARGMTLKAFQRYLIVLAKIAPPDQHSAAHAAFMAQQTAVFDPVHAQPVAVPA